MIAVPGATSIETSTWLPAGFVVHRTLRIGVAVLEILVAQLACHGVEQHRIERQPVCGDDLSRQGDARRRRDRVHGRLRRELDLERDAVGLLDTAHDDVADARQCEHLAGRLAQPRAIELLADLSRDDGPSPSAPASRRPPSTVTSLTGPTS